MARSRPGPMPMARRRDYTQSNWSSPLAARFQLSRPCGGGAIRQSSDPSAAFKAHPSVACRLAAWRRTSPSCRSCCAGTVRSASEATKPQEPAATLRLRGGQHTALWPRYFAQSRGSLARRPPLRCTGILTFRKRGHPILFRRLFRRPQLDRGRLLISHALRVADDFHL
jgi:hypothetical protein